MNEPTVPRSTVIAAMKAIEEETIKKAMLAAREYGDARNRAAANGNDKQKGQVSATYKFSP